MNVYYKRYMNFFFSWFQRQKIFIDSISEKFSKWKPSVIPSTPCIKKIVYIWLFFLLGRSTNLDPKLEGVHVNDLDNASLRTAGLIIICCLNRAYATDIHHTGNIRPERMDRMSAEGTYWFKSFLKISNTSFNIKKYSFNFKIFCLL